MMLYRLSDLETWHTNPPTLNKRPRLAVLGHPVAHSKSPQMHQAALDHHGEACSYLKIDLAPEEFTRGIELLQQLDFIGVNVTIPHKFAALEVADELTDTARLLGTVNTLHFKNGKIHGHNTDGPGLAALVQERFGKPLTDMAVLLLGAAGGAGQATAIQSILAGVPKLVLVNRTVSKAQALVKELQQTPELASALQKTALQVIPWQDEDVQTALPEIDLIVNTSSLGMKEDDPAPFDLDGLTKQHHVLDMVYATHTKLLQAAEERGLSVADGLDMLLHQGALSYREWFGYLPDMGLMRDGLES